MNNATSLNITLLNDSFPPTIDGVANVVVNYAKVLHDLGDTVSVATPAYPEVQDDYPFPVVRYPSFGFTEELGYRAGAPFSPELLHTLTQQAPQIIHTHCPVMSTVLARLLRPQVDAPVIFTYHTKFDIDIQKAVRGKLLQEASIRTLVNNISACDEVWAVSAGAAQNLRSLGYEGECRVMENGVDFPRGEASPQAVAAAAKQWNIPMDRPVFLYVGRMMWYKGLRLTLEALRTLQDVGLDFCFVLVGDGVDRAEIEALAQQLDVAQRCIFTGAIRDREQLRAVFGCADLFVFPSTFDTNGIVVREAAACSCASVLVRGSCAAEGIEDGETGFLIDGTVPDLARCLQWACGHREKLRQVGQQASQRIYLSWQDAVANARTRYLEVSHAWKTGQLRRPEAPGDDFYASAGHLLTELGHTGEALRESHEQARENREAALAALRGGYESYMSFLKNRLDSRFDNSREDLEALLKNLQELWEEQLSDSPRHHRE